MRRRRDRGRRTPNARPSAGYATQTSIRSRNTYTIELQYIRAIRPFLLVSNLGCRGVNRRGPRVTRKQSPAFRDRMRSVGKRALDESGEDPVNGDDEGTRARKCSRVIPGRCEASNPECRDSRCAIAHLRSASLGPSRNDASRNVQTKMAGRTSRPFHFHDSLRLTPGSRPSCRARPAPQQGVRSARDRASTRRSRDRSRGRTRQMPDRRRARRKCRP